MNGGVEATYAVTCVVFGAFLAIYCAGAVNDPFWSKATRRLSWVGLVVGVGTMIFPVVLLA